MKRLFILFGLMALLAFAPAGWAADGKALAEKCASCHKMKGPAAKTIAEIFKRKAPDLFYAGSKFNKDWLVAYIQNPTLIRPAGTVYTNYLKLDGDQDVIGDLPKCAAKLSAGDAAAVADYLMTLKDSSMKTGVVKLGKFSKAKAKRLMWKKEACNACHAFPKKGGGPSCPTFVGIGSRLNPDWVYSFVKDPQRWDPKVWMAKSDLTETDLQLIANYLASLK